MPFQKGNQLAKLGKGNSRSQELRPSELAEYARMKREPVKTTFLKKLSENDWKRMKNVCLAMIFKAEKGDVAAANLIFDRIVGKPTQELTGTDGEPITIVKRIIMQSAQEEVENAQVIENDSEAINGHNLEEKQE